MTENRISEIQSASAIDPELQLLKTVILKGWPTDKLGIPPEVLKYVPIRDEISVQDGLIFRGERVVIPVTLRAILKDKIHSSHLGVEGCLRRTREAIYWPNINSDLKDYISKCSIGRTTSYSQQKESLKSHDVPDRPWAKVATDLFSFKEKDYLILVDYYNNFWEIDLLPNTESITVVRKLKAHFARYGITDILMSDHRPKYTAQTFKRFSESYEFQHITSSPRYSQSNSKAESAVRTAINILRRADIDKSDIFLAILNHRNTPNESRYSPAQCLMSRLKLFCLLHQT